MKALSIRQPWAWLIVHGHKPVENRTWPTNHRGRTLIHAGQLFDREALGPILNAFPELRPLMPQQYELGGIVGLVDIVSCVDEMDSRWFTGPYGFVCRRPRPLPFRKWRGELGFFNVADDVASGLMHQAEPVPEGQKGLFGS